MKKIVSIPGICSGKPHFEGTRLAIEYPLGLLSDGYSTEQVLEEYPELTAEDIQEALAFTCER